MKLLDLIVEEREMMKNQKTIPYSRLIEQCKSRINEIDKMLDNELISDEEFDKLEDEARRLTAEKGRLESCQRLNNVKEISPNEWTINFLKSFGDISTTRIITVRQYEIFYKINNGAPFRCNGLRYDIGKGRNNFGTLIITKLYTE